MAKVYALVHATFDVGSRFGPGNTNTTFELYGDEANALAEMEKLYAGMVDKTFLSVTKHEDGKGFSYGGRMVSFIPGSFTVKEHEIK